MWNAAFVVAMLDFSLFVNRASFVINLPTIISIYFDVH